MPYMESSRMSSKVRICLHDRLYLLSPQCLWSIGRLTILGMKDGTMPARYMESSRMSSAVRICLHDLFLLAASSVPMVNRSVTNTRNEGRHHAGIWSHPGCHLQ